jgi:hypothetical protein
MKAKERKATGIKVRLNTAAGNLFTATLAIGAGFEWIGTGNTEAEAVANLMRNARIA